MAIPFDSIVDLVQEFGSMGEEVIKQLDSSPSKAISTQHNRINFDSAYRKSENFYSAKPLNLPASVFENTQVILPSPGTAIEGPAGCARLLIVPGL